MRVESHKDMLIDFSISEELILEYASVTLQSLEILASRLLFVGVHKLLVESFISQLFGNTRLLDCVVNGRIITAKGQNRLKLTLLGAKKDHLPSVIVSLN